jgi:hypothetical protein
MNIESYKILISNLPVGQQCFTTKRTTWNTAENEIKWLKNLNDKLFGENKTLTISRQEIFQTKEPIEAIIKIIYWGYPAGMRGNHFINILKRTHVIENTILKLREKSRPTTNDFNELTVTFENVEGLGLSTYSKLLYFFQIKFNDNLCLILDQRLIEVFSTKSFSDFHQLSNIRYYNAEKRYLDFLHLTNQVSKKLGTRGENLEQFLFIFGNNLK